MAPFNDFMSQKDMIIPVYFVYQNDSHLYVRHISNKTQPTFFDKVNQFNDEQYINEHEIEPILVNCAVAPLAKECLNLNTTSHPLQNLTSSFLTFLTQQYQRGIISIVLIFLLFALTIFFTRKMLLLVIRQYTKGRSSFHDNAIELQQISVNDMKSSDVSVNTTTEKLLIDKNQNKRIIHSNVYDTLPCNTIKCSHSVSLEKTEL
ncbi:unnamed protein product [Rotaria magnacalcarata]|uniref:Uncharacterized protein n=1 Tax=Rotaria magnacalcarata TaxID=392030 RepID=A0A815UT14_9BILA|nr:unnamed protein product [Rotaria magnacalcarata]CAF1520395.1 unnamed protein product [Rotaria magnacalcarata]CAF2046893.1 unnamed protein product [Rotaria magnacalcarata]CAF3756316.1 unnamed protein product [Rotaria magnacalcarata]CAF3819174.1 unnamed protein product [Rotaria magnacalcarata]